MKLFIRTLSIVAALCLAHRSADAQTATMTFGDPETGTIQMNASGSGGTSAGQATPPPGVAVSVPGASISVYGQSAGVAVPAPRRASGAPTAMPPPGESSPAKAWEYTAARPVSTRQNAERNLVIRSTETDAKTLVAIEEDLNVMARILEKATRTAGDADRPAEAMGVPISVLPASSSARNFQIEGYGAIFQLRVNFPLKGAPEKTEAKPAKEPTNSDWEQSRRELYGSPDSRSPYVKGSSQPEFDSKRVDALKDSLLAALKNASNMSHVKSDETITVVVTSGGKASAWTSSLRTTPDSAYVVSAHDDRTGSVIQNLKDQDGNTITRVVPAGSATETTMTLRAKKSDIDAFAAGKLSLEQFRNKVNWLVY